MWDPKAYVKKLYDQELGFRGGQEKQAGRYFFISKEFSGYFPPLSTIIKNDYAIINIIPPQSDKVVMASFKYHNSKLAENKSNGRDEYRIYLNTDIDPGGDYFKPGDIIILHKESSTEDTVYRTYHFSAIQQGKEYNKLEDLLKKYSSSRVQSSHALVPVEEMSFISEKVDFNVEKKIIPVNVQKDALKEPVISEIAEEEREEMTRLVRSTSFRDLVMFFYDCKCAVTETVISFSSLYNLEAAHIIPRQYKGQNSPKNGIALNRDMHWAFDKGFFTLDGKYNIIVHDVVNKLPLLAAVDRKKILLPSDKRAWPSEVALKWHRENIFGLFLNY